MFGKQEPGYIPLDSRSYDEGLDDNNPLSHPRGNLSHVEAPQTTSYHGSTPRSLLYMSSLLVILTILNGLILPFTLPKYKDLPLSQAELDVLPYPTQGLGLDRAKSILLPRPSWVRSWPLNIVRISQKLKNAVYGDSVQVFISVEDAIIMRFPVPPSESNSASCALAWTPPPALSGRVGDLQTKGDVSEIEVWSIIGPNVLQVHSTALGDIDFDNLSWNTRPVRGELLGTLDLNLKSNTSTEEFGCPDEEDLVVELRCLRVACEVNFKQILTTPKIGFELIRRI